jgi:hypothetical protein
VSRFEFTQPNPAMAGLLSVLLVRGAGVELTPTELDVHLGWTFRVQVPRTAIRSARPDDSRVLGWGAHTSFRGRWLVNTSSRGLVRLTIDPPARGHCTGVPVTVRDLRISLADPEAFLTELGAPR